MKFSDIESAVISNGYNTNSAATQSTLYSVIHRNQLFSRTNRLNAGWGRGKIIIAKYDDDKSKNIKDYLENWSNLTKNFGDQFLCIETSKENWEFYDSHCNKIEFERILPKSTLILNNNTEYNNILPSLRTKPFLLLAGISGTGKSRIVKQMAFDTCPQIEELRKDKTSPGNYQLIEVKPNWHDSTEVLGYESEIGEPHYVVTPFVKFLVKAMLYEDDAPFFVCMDEMNLAPVEQYFAEFLSVLESRKLIDGHITSEALIPADVFKEYEYKGLKAELSGYTEEKCNGYEDANLTEDEEKYGKFNILYDRLKKEGLRIPSNLIVVGTVNMDETTHQFSRKVIDRAMTIEMNIADGSKPFAEFFENDADLKYRDEPLDKDLFVSKVVQAKEALELLATENASDVDYLKANIPALLSNLNEALNGTPFKIAYRVQNELVIYFFELRRENKETKPEDLLGQAMDAILMQKVLPRVEGDEDLLEKPLERLHAFTQNYKDAHAKVEEMQARLNAHFTSFWP